MKRFLFIPILVVSTAQIFGQTIDQVIDQYLEAAGGRELISQMTKIEISASLNMMGTIVEMKVTQEYPNKSSTLTTMDGMEIYRDEFDGVSGYQITNGIRQVYTGHLLEQRKYRNIFNEPLYYKQFGIELQYLGTVEYNYQNYYQIMKTTPADEVSYIYYNAATGLPYQVVASDESSIIYEDFRPVQGVMFPHQWTLTTAGGEMTGSVNNVNITFGNSSKPSTTSQPVATTTAKKPSLTDNKSIINYTINTKLKQWMTKDMFETTDAYRARITDANRDVQIEQWTKQVVDSLTNAEKTNFDLSIHTKTYDADNQTYQLKLSDGKEIYLPVPATEARPFYTGNTSLENPELIMNKDFQFELAGMEIVSDANGKRYPWKSSTDVAFSVTDLNINYEEVDVALNTRKVTKGKVNVTKKRIDAGASDVDINIPKTGISNPDAIAVVIGNRHYQGDVPDVDYAIHDAEIMKKYLENTFGFKPGNILYEEDATRSKIAVLFGDEKRLGRLSNYIRADRSDVFVFYSGHGAPDTNTQTGYLMPVDADPSALAITGYSIDLLYQNLGQLKARSVQVVIDACFSGGSGSGKMLIDQASPIGIQVKNPAAQLSDGVIITASQGNQISSWYKEKSHGLFTYFYLKGLRGEADLNNDGQITSGELKEYLQHQSDGVPYWARRLHGRDQVPQVFGVTDRVIVKLR